MGDCKEISERILMGLDPEEFPEEAREARKHLEECTECMTELESLGRLVGFLREHKEELAAAVAPCPPAEAIAAAALGEPVDPSIAAHVAFCPECSECVDALRAAAAEQAAPQKDAPDAREKRVIRRAVEREYGPEPATRQETQRSFAQFVWSVFRMPSFAVAAAAAVAVAIWLHVPSEEVLRPAFSDLAWQVQEKPAAARDLIRKSPAVKRRSVAVMIFAAGKEDIRREDLGALYERMDLPVRVKGSYEIVPPGDVKQALAGTAEAAGLDAWARLVFTKLTVDYYLSVQVSRSGTEYAIKAALFKRGQAAAVGTMAQAGLTAERIPSRISSMGEELLTEAALERSGKNSMQRK